MWIVAIAWMYVAVMMALAEAFGPQGSILGAIITLLFYGIAPLALVMYLLGTPARRRARRAAEAAQAAQAAQGEDTRQAPKEAAGSTLQPDAGGLPARGAVAPERKEP